MSNWKGTYDEIRRKKQANISRREYEAELVEAELEAELSPQKDYACNVISTGTFLSDGGDADQTKKLW